MKLSAAILAGAFAGLIFAPAASAQDESDTEKHFAGPYVALGAGYADFQNVGDGGFLELGLGWRHQTDSGWVYGIEALGALAGSGDRFPGEDIEFFDFDGYLSILGKLGYTPNNKVMFYGGAGYTSLDVIDTFDDPDTAGGAMFEAGLEVRAASWLDLRLRGQYHTTSGDADITTIGASFVFNF